MGSSMNDGERSPFGARESFSTGSGTAAYYSLPRLELEGVGPVSRLPVSLRIVLESLVRNVDGRRVREKDVVELANWKPNAERTAEIPFVVARIVLQDFTGVPLL
ncbi:MAG TPA: aconitate hydratase, partial [Thermoanaerobaculia bacterium]|nr:aconitate hydratase [Thermoanaerobaculia bacterium]